MSRRSFSLVHLTLMGPIIGAGAFALPSLFARFGQWPVSFVFWGLALLIALMHVFYVDVILAVPATHRLPGHVRAHLGARWAAFASFTHLFSIYGAHVIYLLLAGTFAHSLAAAFGWGLPARLGMLALFAAGYAALRGGLRKMATVESALTALKIGLFIGAVALAFRHGAAPTRFVPSPGWGAFGIVLFALSGLPAVGELVDLAGRKRETARRAAAFGTLVSAFVLWAFATVFAWAGGTSVTGDPRSLAGVLGAGGSVFIPVLGLLAIGTAYLSTGEDLQNTWIRDYRFRPSTALALTLVPSLLFALLLDDGFLLLVTIIGTVCGGANGVLVGMMRVAVGERRRETAAVALALLIVFAYAFGMSGQIASWLFL